MAAVSTVSMLDSEFKVDKLTCEIFSILENKFLFGYNDPNLPCQVQDMKSGKNLAGKCRILSVGGGGCTDGLLAAKSLVHLESYLRQKSGNPRAHISDYFDAVAGSGAGGVLVSLLFTRGKDGSPMFSADGALKFLLENRRLIFGSSSAGLLRRVFRPAKAEKVFRKTFGDVTIKDTIKSVLIPCYDLTTGAPFVFSRADAFETDGYDFKMRDVCAATSADPGIVGAVEMASVDRRTKILAVGGGIAMNNPTAAAITHVLNNKQEFPFCKGVEDLLVLSLGNGESDSCAGNLTPTTKALVKIAGDGAADMVDQAVSVAFGECRTANYVRIQGNGIVGKKGAIWQQQQKQKTAEKETAVMIMAERMLAQKNVESVLFQGKKLVKNTNLEKLGEFAGELVREKETRKKSILPYVVLKQQGSSPSPRTSSATTLSSLSSN